MARCEICTCDTGSRARYHRTPQCCYEAIISEIDRLNNRKNSLEVLAQLVTRADAIEILKRNGVTTRRAVGAEKVG
jgi:hypothetical protein